MAGPLTSKARSSHLGITSSSVGLSEEAHSTQAMSFSLVHLQHRAYLVLRGPSPGPEILALPGAVSVPRSIGRVPPWVRGTVPDRAIRLVEDIAGDAGACGRVGEELRINSDTWRGW